MKNYNKLFNEIMMIPIPTNINYMWNNGSILGVCFLTQFMSGLSLIIYYSPSINEAFDSIMYIMRESNYGFILRLIHMNTASMFFLFMYLHISRSLFYKSFMLNYTWKTGVIILILSTMTAFLGYTLPWGQMSYWGAIVITNLITSVPFIGNQLLELIWGNFSMNKTTLMRFFNLHYILPFIILLMIIVHMLMLHKSYSNNPLGLKQNNDLIFFHPYFTWKDYLGFLVMILILMLINLINPYILMNKENFFMANPLVTPIHIEPEWYFLYAYSMLRSIPNKLGGTIALISALSILFFIPLFNKNVKFKTMKFYPINKSLTCLFYINFIMLTIMGIMPISEPFLSMTQFFTLFYFSYFFMSPFMMWIQDKL